MSINIYKMSPPDRGGECVRGGGGGGEGVGRGGGGVGRACILTHHDGLNNLGRGSLKKQFCNIIFKRSSGFLPEIFESFLYKCLGKISPTPGSHIFNKSSWLEQSW